MQFNVARFTCIYYIYDRNGTNRRPVMMIRVKVNSKSELVEDREGKAALYRCNLLL